MDTGIHIGGKVDAEVVKVAADKVIEILSARADQKTIRMALRVLETSVTIPDQEVENTSISNCTLISEPAKPTPRKRAAVKRKQ